MKLRNKKTREIGKIAKINLKDEEIEIITDTKVYIYTSLLKISMEWEDYEEPKDYYYISDIGNICVCEIGKFTEDEEDQKQIGNYFGTREEAEKAVEKLKAWKRLKDKGFRFRGYMRRSDWADLPKVTALENFIDITVELPSYKINGSEKDLDLLFGGEE